jgi:hypothetical protein
MVERSLRACGTAGVGSASEQPAPGGDSERSERSEPAT